MFLTLLAGAALAVVFFKLGAASLAVKLLSLGLIFAVCAFVILLLLFFVKRLKKPT